jgi:hypothetical protein
MRRIVAALIFAAVLIQPLWTPSVQGDTACSFVGDFASLRDLVGALKVGDCAEDEHISAGTGDTEQRTSGGLLVRRASDGVSAFTDGGTTWLNGPNGLQSRANSDRFSWEGDPGSSTSTQTSAITIPPASSASASTSPSARVAGSPVSSPAASTDSSSAADAAAAAAAQAALTADASASTPTPTATITPTATVTPTPTVTKVPTATPNPIDVNFSDKPNDVDTGSDQHVEVETNAKKATCTFTVTYHNTALAGLGTDTVNDGKCQFTWNIPDGTKTGEAVVAVTVTGSDGTNTADEHFDINKGDTFLTGDVNISLDVNDFPDEGKVGEALKFSVDTSLGNKGTCSLTVTWPQVGATAGDNKTPSDGKCSWTMTVPATITKKGTASAVITVTNRSGTARAVTKEFDVKLP